MEVKIKDRKEEIEFLRMACNMAELGIGYQHADKIENIDIDYFTASNSVEVIKLKGKRGKEKILYLHNIEGDVFVIFESLTDFIFYFEKNEVMTCIASLDTEDEVEEFLLNYKI